MAKGPRDQDYDPRTDFMALPWTGLASMDLPSDHWAVSGPQYHPWAWSRPVDWHPGLTSDNASSLQTCLMTFWLDMDTNPGPALLALLGDSRACPEWWGLVSMLLPLVPGPLSLGDSWPLLLFEILIASTLHWVSLVWVRLSGEVLYNTKLMSFLKSVC